MPATVGFRAYTGSFMSAAFTPNFGVSANQDDFAVVTVTNSQGPSYVPIAPSGWSTLYNDTDDGVMYALFYKKLTAGEAIPQFTTPGNYNGQWRAWLFSKGDSLRNYTQYLDYVYPSNSYINIPALGGAVVGDRDLYWIFATRDYSAFQIQTYQVGGAASGFTQREALSYGQGHADKAVTVAGTQDATSEPGATAGGQQRYRIIRVLIAPTNTAPGAPGTPTVSPSPVDASMTVTFSAATDPDGDAVTHELEYAADGVSFSVISSNFTSGSSISTSAYAPTSTAKVRVRAKDSVGLYGPYATSAAFTVGHTPYVPRIMR